MTKRTGKSLADELTAVPDAGLEKLRGKLAETERENKRLRELLEESLRAAEAARAPRLKLPTIVPRKSGKGDFVRVIIPDTHGCQIDPLAESLVNPDAADARGECPRGVDC